MKNPGDVLAATLAGFGAFLDERAAATADAGPGRLVVPRRRVMVMGQPAWDCEALVVHSSALYQGSPGQRLTGYQTATGGITLYSFDVGVTLVRSAPVLDNAGRPPTPAALEAAATQAGDDADALSAAFWASVNDSSIVGPCDLMYHGGIDFSGPAGGLAATTLNLSVQL